MKFSTPIPIQEYPFQITHNTSIVSFGSCFSENIGEKLAYHKFDICINPFGILFNPISVSRAIEDCLAAKEYTENELKTNNQIHFSYNHHSSFSSLSRKETLDLINKGIKKGGDYLEKSKTVIITLGTAWVYKLKETNETVANCYKMPANLFTKELLSINSIVDAMNKTIAKLKEQNPEINIITTISPVRHWKDGVVENQQSKSTLHLALKQINETHLNCHYFPSYEIMMDELRDYRFYAKDMLHPSELAIEYIWDKFADSFFDIKTKELNKRISQIQREKNHKLLNPESKDSIAFSKKIKEKEIQLYSEFPFLKH